MSATTLSSSVAEQITRARAAQAEWSSMPVGDRLQPVRTLRRLLVDRCDRICQAVADDLGKSTQETIGGDLLPWADACLFLERQANRLLKPRKVPRSQRPLWLMGQHDVVHRRPRGVVGVIGTWNYPLFLNGVQLVQALTAGNAVVWKPSEVAPATADLIGGLFREAGFPEQLVQVLPAARDFGPVLTAAPIDHLVFTGSAEVGRIIARQLGERLVSSTLELSGCDAMVILDDADLAFAAKAAWFGMVLNRGQTCLAVRRIFVPESLCSTFLDHLGEHASQAKPCRLALPGQVEQANRLVEDALAGGAKLLVQTPPAEMNDTFSPAVLVNARPEMAVCREASFAPIAAVLSYSSVDEVLHGHAQCPYRLGASVFSRDTARAQTLAARLHTGAVTINDVIAPTAHPATPFGGHGASGWGVTQGAEGLLEMTVPQVVSVRGGSYRPHYDLSTADGADHEALLRGLLESAHAPSWLRRLSGWKKLLGALWRGWK